METIQKLTDVLTSQYHLYEDLLVLLKEEKKNIIQWNIDKTLELAKNKDTILYKEKLLEEAREKILKRINNKFEADLSLKELINKLDDPKQIETLSTLRQDIKKIALHIQTENISIKLLYKTNIKMISDVFEKIGLAESSGYQFHGKIDKRQGNSFVRSA